MAEFTPEKGIPCCCVCYIWRNYSTFPLNKTIILYFKHAVIIPSTLSSSVWLSLLHAQPFTLSPGLMPKHKALRPQNFFEEEKGLNSIPSPTFVVNQ